MKISNHDGTAVTSNKAEVVVRHGYSREDEVYEVNRYNLDKNGMVKLEYVTPVNVTSTAALRIEVKLHEDIVWKSIIFFPIKKIDKLC